MSVYSKIDPDKITPELKGRLSYEYDFWYMTRRGMRKKTQNKCMMSKGGVFLSGFQRTVTKHTGIKFENKRHKFEKLRLNGIEIDAQQRRMLRKAKRYDRGVFHAPTGVGKTVIAASILSIFRNYKSVFVCNTRDLFLQTENEFVKILGIECNLITEGSLIDKNSNLTIAMAQSLKNHFHFLKNVEIVIVDECHEDMEKDGRLWDFFHEIDAKKIYGLTATLPNEKKRALYVEGLVGPVIGRITYQQGIESGRLSDVIVNFVKIKSVSRKKHWNSEYDFLINNPERNRKICDIVKHNKGSFLIIVVKIVHGELLEEILNENGLKAIFISGKDDKETRFEVKKELERKKKVVITTKIWNKGINIPNLNHVINAGGMKGEISTLQIAGRGTRRTKGKSVVIIWDFLDKGKYIGEHAEQRLKTYVKMNWQINYKNGI